MRGPLYHLHRTLRRGLLLGTVSLLYLALGSSKAPTELDRVLDRGVLRMITVLGPTTYYENARGPTGFEYLLARSFADHLGVELEVTLMDSLGGILASVGSPKGDFAAAGLTVTPRREQRILFSEPYAEVTQKLIYRAGRPRPREVGDLIGGDLVAIARSSHTERLEELRELHTELSWREHPLVEMLELMEMVHNGEADYAVVDSDAYLVNRSLFPGARGAFDISEPQPLAWVFPMRKDDSLRQAASRFLREFRESGDLARLQDQFHGHTGKFSPYGARVFMQRLNTLLPQYLDTFHAIADQLEIDWHLLAAIAYQESHWNPRAVSPTGVVGMMMLTRAAASEVDVTDRRDPQQSIEGGARYFLASRERIPERIQEPDRTWFALAAYNVGYGHLEDARILTQRHGKNPDLWEDVKQHLPLLQQKAYYSTVRHGYARGWEPVHYVENIRYYRSLLQWHTLTSTRREERSRQVDLPPPTELDPGLLRPL